MWRCQGGHLGILSNPKNTREREPRARSSQGENCECVLIYRSRGGGGAPKKIVRIPPIDHDGTPRQFVAVACFRPLAPLQHCSRERVNTLIGGVLRKERRATTISSNMEKVNSVQTYLVDVGPAPVHKRRIFTFVLTQQLIA